MPFKETKFLSGTTRLKEDKKGDGRPAALASLMKRGSQKYLDKAKSPTGRKGIVKGGQTLERDEIR